MRSDSDWLRSRQLLLKKAKAEVNSVLGQPGGDVVRYSRSYEKELQGPWKISSKSELLEAVDGAHLVYGGDFHAFGQTQRTHLKILRSLPETRSVILALECLPARAQKAIDQYIEGGISVEELRREVRWDRTWGFPWENYRPLLELARARSWRLLGVGRQGARNKKETLRSRETFAAEKIARAHGRFPTFLIYTIFGELHLAKAHLPQAVKRCRKRFKKGAAPSLVLHVNPEKIYFQLARRGLEHSTDVVRLRNGDFAILSSPPWVQWQSYLLFLEKQAEARERLQDVADDDPTDQVAALVRLAAGELGVRLKVDDFSVATPESAQFWRSLDLRKADRSLDGEFVKSARELGAQGKSFYLPLEAGGGIGVLGRSSINHAAALAGHVIFAKLAKTPRALWRMPEDFVPLIWAEGVAYFVSKIINHKRQSETLTDLHSRLLAPSVQSEEEEVLKLALDYSASELRDISGGAERKRRFRPRRKSSYHEAARILGGMTGERLYLAYRSRKMTRGELVKLLKQNPLSESFQDEYRKIVRRLTRRLGKAHAQIKTQRERL